MSKQRYATEEKHGQATLVEVRKGGVDNHGSESIPAASTPARSPVPQGGDGEPPFKSARLCEEVAVNLSKQPIKLSVSNLPGNEISSAMAPSPPGEVGTEPARVIDGTEVQGQEVPAGDGRELQGQEVPAGDGRELQGQEVPANDGTEAQDRSHQAQWRISLDELTASFNAQRGNCGKVLRVPLCVAGLFLFASKLIALWLVLIFSVIAVQAAYERLPESLRKRLMTRRLRRFLEVPIVQECNYAVRQLRPFLYAGLFIAAAPLTVVVIFVSWVHGFFGKPKVEQNKLEPVSDSIVLHQNTTIKEDRDEHTFFLSRAFAPTIFAICALGLPAALAIALYQLFGVDQLLQGISHTTIHHHARPDLLTVPRPWSGVLREHVGVMQLARSTWPTAISEQGFWQFSLYVYLMSLAWCISTLLLRAYFTFPLNFMSTEYDIELNEKGIRKSPIKGWCAEVLWYSMPAYLPREVSWKEVEWVRFREGGFGRLSPLPDTLFPKRSLLYKFLNRLAGFTDGIVDKLGRTEFIEFGGGADTTYDSGIKIRLWELSEDEKARLFYAIRQWCPSIYPDERVQEKLVGSSVMKEPRYTEIWFDLLMHQRSRLRHSELKPGDLLQGGQYRIIERIGAGGQAVVYLADMGGSTVVLKEFTLSDADAAGALVGSALDFENETTVLSRLSHPQVVKMLSMFAEDQRAYVVLEQVEGRCLREFVQQNQPLAEAKVAALAVQMCNILQYLHGQEPPVVHRDFTPENLILQENGELKLIDFSVASKTGPHESGDCVGKHSYTPPEQFRSEPCPQSDIYAAGATIYFLLTGFDPRPISQSDPRLKRTDISDALAQIVMKATDLDLAARYESAAWMLLDLTQLTSG